MKRKKAKFNVQIDNNIVRVTKYTLGPGEETGIHKHKYDYVVTPITKGKLLLVDKKGEESHFNLLPSKSYFRKSGIEHNVINSGKEELIFVELEFKNKRRVHEREAKRKL